MKINLQRFTEDREVICPITNGKGQCNGRKMEFNVDDGWYNITIGNKTEINRSATPLEIEKTLKDAKSYYAYPIGNEAIPASFDTFRRKGYSETINFYFGENTELFVPIKIGEWEDGNYYFYKEAPNHQRETLQFIKDRFGKNQNIKDVKKVTPEQRLLFILSKLYQNSYEAYLELQKTSLSEETRKKALEKYTMDFGQRLKVAIGNTGARYISHTKRGLHYLVEWEVNGQLIKSKIKDNMKIINAGFCLSGDDEKHSIASLSLLAQMFQRDEPLYITRH